MTRPKSNTLDPQGVVVKSNLERSLGIKYLKKVSIGRYIEVQLEVWDSPNSAGVVIDAVRYMKFFKDADDLESLDLVSAWLMKAPAIAAKDSDTLQKLHELTHQEED